jgi:fibronectin-binding autotransporter adhesin
MIGKSTKSWLAAVLLGLLMPSAGFAANLVWDGSAAAGYLNADGTWGSDNFWCNQNAAGRDGTTLISWVANNIAWFGGNAGIGSNAAPSGNFTVTVLNTQAVAGVRQIQNGDGNYTLSGGTLDFGVSASGVRVDTNRMTVNSVLSGTGTTFQINVQCATGVLELGGNNTYSGTSEIRGVAGGTIRLNNAGALGTGSAVSFINGSVTLDLNGQNISGKNATVSSGQTGFIGNSGGSASTWLGNIALASSTANIRAGGTGSEVEVDGIISGDGTVQVMDGGTLRLSGANTYTNITTVRDGGTLIVNNASALGTPNGITYVQTGSKLNLNGFNIGTEGIDMQKAGAELLNNAGTAATANGTISLSAAGQKIGGSGDLNLGGIISGTNGFEKTGAGTLTLSGSGTYLGTTVVSNGLLVIDGDNSAATNTLTVAADAVLSGSGRIGGAAVVYGGLKPGSNGTGSLTFSADVLLDGASTTTFEIVRSDRFDVAANDGGDAITFADGANVVFDFAGYSGGTASFPVLSNWTGRIALGEIVFSLRNLPVDCTVDLSGFISSGAIKVTKHGWLGIIY